MATILPAHQTAVVNLYTALFNRAPDAAGLGFWAQALADGAPLARITESFLATTEGRATYPASQTSTQFVASFYQTVFGRTADTGGLAFWTAALDAAGGAGSDAARSMLVAQIVNVVTVPLSVKPADMTDAQYAQTVGDRALFANKVAVGTHFAVTLAGTDVTLARNTLVRVTQDPASVATANGFAERGGVDLPSVPPVPTLSLTKADTPTDIASKFAAYPGTAASVDATDMDGAQWAAVAGGVAKIADGGIRNLALVLNDPAVIGTVAAELLSKATAAKVVADGADAAELAAIVAALPNIAANGISGALALTSATDAPDITALLSKYGGTSATANATGMITAQLAVVAGNAAKLAVGGLTGSVMLNAELDLATLLGAMTATAANVQVNAIGMTNEQLVVVATQAGKVDGLSNLPPLQLAAPLLTATVISALLALAPTASVSVVAASSAAGTDAVLTYLSKIAAAGISGELSLTAAQFATTNAGALSPKLAAGAALSVSGTGVDESIDLSGYAIAVRVDGGAGQDTLIVNNAAALGAAAASNQITGIEVLHAKSGTSAYLDKIAGVTQLSIDASSGGVEVLNLTGAQALAVDILAAVSPVKIGLANSAGGTHLKANVVTTTAGGVAQSIDLTDITLLGFTSLELNGSGRTPAGGLTLTTTNATSLQEIMIRHPGGDVTLKVAAGHTGSTLDINLTGAGAVNVDASASTIGVTVQAGTAGGLIVGSGRADMLLGGAGNDMLVGDGSYSPGVGFGAIPTAASADVMNGGAGNDIYVFAKNSSGLTAIDRIIGLDLGGSNGASSVDKLLFQLDGLTSARVIEIIPSQLATLNTNAAASNSITPAIQGALSGHARAKGDIVMFTLDHFGKTFILLNGDGNNTFDPNADFLIEVTGVTNTLDASDIQFAA